MKSLISFVVLFFVALVHAISSSGDRLLVLLEDVAEKEGYSKFLGDLEGRGFQINYETPKSEGLSLFHLGEKSYDHVLFLPTKSKGLGPNLTPKILLDFINANGNILLALSASQPAPTSIVSLLLELDIHLPSDRQGLVVDHFNYDVLSAPEKHDVLLLPPPGLLRPDVKDFFSPVSTDGGVIAFPSGTGQTLGSGALLTPILRAPSTSYSYNPKEQAEVIDELFASGSQLSLVSTFQARNSARFTVIGSAEMLSDKWFDAKVKKVGEDKEVNTINREFAKRVAGWTFKEIGVLRVNWIEHHLNEVGQSNASNPKIYRIKNDVTYSISLSEYSWDKYTPFTVPDNDDLQLEFSMLSPFHRLQLNPTISSEDSTTYSVSFKLPDQHGIFNFKVNYKRPFYSNVEEKNTVSVRHFAHDEWPRSYVISGAWPWIAGISATVTGWLGFCALWLYSKPTTTSEKKRQ
ncbi:Dolichyl-diphosphooligosaccharide-protein glycosyltransferase 48kDa subunit [Daldinia vernicosa]|uniref:Dolichyl-diphosphooligosaccharide-protein glycosyltransferase 48kDa subunit n=1 Tax=Daldinia vernicosa TaxID=114800 RepID=UPI002007B083|nr:Dolichyl-diphosphooligosaccharide-protein glycosyltransferase 48kDa subunit [Daldinia vernicosa]KAI0845875.1 Dolichyl-diphosphooligosaccharide-protein glycosyltransferase 48kDa subunit [Daldinia vernicosa]